MEDSLEFNESEIESTMTIEEKEIALAFLKKRFPEYSIEEVIMSLTQYLQNKHVNFNEYDDLQDIDRRRNTGRNSNAQRDYRRTINRPRMADMRPRRITMTANSEERLNKFEEMRLVAKVFCESGMNYNLVRYFFPNMTPQQYRCYLETINNQTLNEIHKFLRYECNIQHDQFSFEQKRTLKGQLIRVREWLGHKSIEELETYYKFIERHYEQKQVEITYDQTLKLYKTLLHVVKSPHLDMAMVERQPNFHERNEKPGRNNKEYFIHTALNRSEEVQIIDLYLKSKNMGKVSDKMIDKNGQSSKWSKENIKHFIKYALKTSMKKLILSKDKYLDRSNYISFDASEENVICLLDAEDAIKEKSLLLTFYLKSRVTQSNLIEIIHSLNKFYQAQNQFSSLEICQETEVKLNKLEDEKTDIASINLDDQPHSKMSIVIDIQEQEQHLPLQETHEGRVIKDQQTSDLASNPHDIYHEEEDENILKPAVIQNDFLEVQERETPAVEEKLEIEEQYELVKEEIKGHEENVPAVMYIELLD